jgi:hypothetical protein
MTKAEPIITKFFTMYCPSRVRPKGITVKQISGKRISGRKVPGIWNARRISPILFKDGIKKAMPIATSHRPKRGTMISGVSQ